MTDNLTFDAAKQIQECPPPSMCSSCYAQQPDKRHVDFSSSWDGPVLTTGSEQNPTRVSIDELILCEDCLATAAKVIGLENPQQAMAERDEAVARAEELSERLAGALKALDAKEKADTARASLLDELKA